MIGDFIKYYIRHNFYFRKCKEQINVLSNLDQFSLNKERSVRFVELVHQAYNQSPFYKKFYDDHGVDISDVKNIKDCGLLPVLTKKDIRENLDQIFWGTPRKVKGYTSGSTGTPLTIYRTYKSIVRENAYVWWYRNKHGLMEKDMKFVFRGDLNKEILFKMDRVSNSLYISSYNLNATNQGAIIKLFNKYNPKAIIGYPSAIHSLSELLEGESIDVPLCFTSSEKLYDFQEEQIFKSFNAKVYDWYGNSERTVALGRMEGKLYSEPPLYAYIEPNDNGIITTSLINPHFPLIRYAVEDQLIFDSNNVPMGINGRSDDSIILKDGTKIGSPGLSTSFKNVKGILYTQIIQHEMSFVDVNIVVDLEFNDREEATFLGNLKDRIGSKIRINIHRISRDQLVYSANGKFKFIINRVSN